MEVVQGHPARKRSGQDRFTHRQCNSRTPILHCQDSDRCHTTPSPSSNPPFSLSAITAPAHASAGPQLHREGSRCTNCTCLATSTDLNTVAPSLTERAVVGVSLGFLARELVQTQLRIPEQSGSLRPAAVSDAPGSFSCLATLPA